LPHAAVAVHHERLPRHRRTGDMIQLKGLAHFSIPVSDVERSVRFYTEVLGCKYLSAMPDKSITFLDAGGDCVLLIHRPAYIPPSVPEGSGGVHHAFMIDEDQYEPAKAFIRSKGVEIFFEEDRRNGTVNGPRFYFRDPDGTPLELIYRTSYNVEGRPPSTSTKSSA
jgi:glyoxylase I family protein